MGPGGHQHHQDAEHRLHAAGQHPAQECPAPGLALLPQRQGNGGALGEVLDADAQGQSRRTRQVLSAGRQGKGQTHRHALRHVM